MLHAARFLFLLLVFSLPFMHHGWMVGGFQALPTDLIYLLCVSAFGLAVVSGDIRLRWHPMYWFVGAYFAALALSALLADNPLRSVAKLATQVYLLSLPVLAHNLAFDLRRVVRWWLVAAAIVSVIGLGTVFLFYAGADPAHLAYSLHPHGTLAPGAYPRIQSTFLYPALLNNYLTVSIMLLLAARRLGWIAAPAFAFLLVAMGGTALFSLTPGLGGLILAVGLWVWLERRETSPAVARIALVAGAGAACASVLAATVTPILHPTAPFLISVSGLDRPLVPSVRLMGWIDSVRIWAADPVFGRGIGDTGLGVRYIDPSGRKHIQTDAHNVFLNIAVQCGLVGLAALLALIGRVVRETRPRSAVSFALGIAWLSAFVYQGLTGSYEDARWLWIALGLLLVANDEKLPETPEAPRGAAFHL